MNALEMGKNIINNTQNATLSIVVPFSLTYAFSSRMLLCLPMKLGSYAGAWLVG